MPTPPNFPIGTTAFVRTLEAHTATPVMPGNRVDPLFNGSEIFPAELAAIAAARRSITYAQYYWDEGSIGHTVARALGDRCAAGVAVRVLLDGFGAMGMPEAHRQILVRAGCRVAVFRPLMKTPLPEVNYRQHARLLVVDGRIGFTGGSGISREWDAAGVGENAWRETDVRVEGPAVAALQAAFVRRWAQTTGEMLGGEAYFPSLASVGDVPVQIVDGQPWHGQRSIRDLFLLSFAGAQQSVLVTNPYFLPDESLTGALIEAARRGVRVALLLPGKIDYRFVRRASRAEFGAFLRAGVEIYEYQPARLHAKTAVIDGRIAIVGSANLDPRSLELNAEVELVAHSPAVAARLSHAFTDDVARARRVGLADWRARPITQRLLELLLRPFRPQL
ncbi:MAG: cardiolipin synthase B [Candidatus Rokubacteria bacterium]|nr:cardiolipin synthase B [Candidatus Rokubacteria bacterium]